MPYISTQNSSMTNEKINFFLVNEQRLGVAFLLHRITKVIVHFEGQYNIQEITNIIIKADNNNTKTEDAPIKVFRLSSLEYDSQDDKWIISVEGEQTITLTEAIHDHVINALDITNMDWAADHGSIGIWTWSTHGGLNLSVHTKYVHTELTYEHTGQLGCGYKVDSGNIY